MEAAGALSRVGHSCRSTGGHMWPLKEPRPITYADVRGDGLSSGYGNASAIRAV